MQQIILFGLPGAGKTFTGKLLSDVFEYRYVDGDDELPTDMKMALEKNDVVTDEMRDRFMNQIRNRFKEIIENNEKVVLSQTFIKDSHRKIFLEQFPESTFILLEAPEHVRTYRYESHKIFTFTPSYWKSMAARFEPISIPFKQIINDSEGTTLLIDQLNLLLKKKEMK
jgi:gluconate kinase